MRIFMDTANIEEIRRGAALGVVDGPVSAECISLELEALLAEARRVAAWHPNVVVKIPMCEVGLRAIRRLAAEGVKVNCTLIFSANQALLAAKAGAAYVSPFVGRLNDAGQDGMAVVREAVAIFDAYHLPAQVLAASIRGPRDVTEAALAGAHVATVPSAVLFQMIQHPLTDRGIAIFLRDAQKYSAV